MIGSRQRPLGHQRFLRGRRGLRASCSSLFPAFWHVLVAPKPGRVRPNPQTSGYLELARRTAGGNRGTEMVQWGLPSPGAFRQPELVAPRKPTLKDIRDVPIFHSMTLAKFFGAVIAVPAVIDRVMHSTPDDGEGAVVGSTTVVVAGQLEEGASSATANGQSVAPGGSDGNDDPQPDWRTALVPAEEEAPSWVDDAVGLWPLQELRAGLTSYSGPGDMGDLSGLSELELAELTAADDQ